MKRIGDSVIRSPDPLEQIGRNDSRFHQHPVELRHTLSLDLRNSSRRVRWSGLEDGFALKEIPIERRQVGLEVAINSSFETLGHKQLERPAGIRSQLLAQLVADLPSRFEYRFPWLIFEQPGELGDELELVGVERGVCSGAGPEGGAEIVDSQEVEKVGRGLPADEGGGVIVADDELFVPKGRGVGFELPVVVENGEYVVGIGADGLRQIVYRELAKADHCCEVRDGCLGRVSEVGDDACVVACED